MTEKITKNFEKAMKKGFLSTLILLILKEKASHGYGIIKKIEKRTFGLWTPPASSIYTVLNDLNDKKLISSIDAKSKKIYKITLKGEKILKRMLKKYNSLHTSMKSIIEHTFCDDAECILSEGIKPLFFTYIDKEATEMTDDQVIEKLEEAKNNLTERRESLNDNIERINKRLEELKKKG